MRILSDADARNLMAWVQAEDIHLANVVKMGDIYRTYFEQRAALARTTAWWTANSSVARPGMSARTTRSATRSP
jgi:hypothetical protein